MTTSRSPDRRAIAASYGAETAEQIVPLHHGFDIAVEATGRVDALACACRSLVPEGICESAGGSTDNWRQIARAVPFGISRSLGTGVRRSRARLDQIA